MLKLSGQPFPCAINCTGYKTGSPKSKITIVNSTCFPASPDGKDEERLSVAKKAFKQHSWLTKKMHVAATSHDLARQKKVVREWEKSCLVRIWAGIEVNAELPVEERLTLQQVEKLTKSLYLDRAIAEPVNSWRVPKTGGYRYICEFGFQNQTLHHLIRAMYAPFFAPKPFQFEYRREGQLAGIALAINQIREALLSGMSYFAHLDIVAFYPSFKEKEQQNIVPGLRRVTIHNTGRHLNIVPKGPKQSHNTISTEAHRGAPQGSALSPLLAAIIVSKLDWKSGTLLINWADNFLILGPSKAAVEQAMKALVSQVAELPGGDFKLSIKERGHAGSGFEFLGHQIELKDQAVFVKPAALDRLDDKLIPLIHLLEYYRDHVEACDPDKVTDWAGEGMLDNEARRNLAKAGALVEAWANAFSQCNEIEELKLTFLDNFEHFRFMLKISWEALKEYRPDTPVWHIY